MTTSRFVFSTQKTIDLCYLKLVPDRWQRKLFSKRFLWPGITAYFRKPCLSLGAIIGPLVRESTHARTI